MNLLLKALLAERQFLYNIYWSHYRRSLSRWGMEDRRTIAARQHYLGMLTKYYEVAHRIRVGDPEDG